MAEHSNIDWCGATWNPVTGCSPISPGCENCYARRWAHWLQAAGKPKYKNGFAVTTHEKALELPRHWPPKMVFVNSMSDLFHPYVPDEFIRKTFRVMVETPHHIYLVLTKRPKRMVHLTRQGPGLPWAPHIWAGVSVENQDYLWRLDYLRQVPAEVRFVSFEPLLGPIRDPNLDGIHWVIVGGESGPGFRPMDLRWARELRDLCIQQGIPFFLKQLGGRTPKARGNLLDGEVWHQYPAQYYDWKMTVAKDWRRGR